MPTSHGRSSTLSVALALGTVYIVWGSTYLAIAYVVETLPPIMAGGVRFTVAGSLLLAFLLAQARWRRRRAPESRLTRPRLIEWRTAAIVGTFLLLGGNGLVSVAEQRIPSSIAAVIIATVPIWMNLGEAVMTRRMPSLLAIGGLGVGLVGVAILLLPSEGIDAIDPVGVVIVMCSALAWTAGSLYARRAPLPANQLMGSGMEQLVGGGVMLAVAVLLGEYASLEPGSVSTESLLGLAYLIVFGSLIAFTAYVWLLEHAPISTVATYAYVNPVVAVFLGVLFRDEPLTPRILLAAALIIGAVVAMVSGRPRGADEARPGAEVATLEAADDAA
ncbi:MAG TPA: EamA family transporter [Candidatus Limnocylindria bacterium]|jgi:drug/metabolite transporter (DMT)-like permease